MIRNRFKQKLEIDGPGDELIKGTKDYSGAEIEAVIQDALYEMLGSKETDLRKLLKRAIADTQPQAKINPEYFAKMRDKSKQGYRMANDVEEVAKLPKRNLTI